MFVSKKKILSLFFVICGLLIPMRLSAITSDQVKAIVDTVVSAGVGEIIPPPISLPVELVRNAPDLIQGGTASHIRKRIIDYMSTNKLDTLQGIELEIFKHKLAKLEAMHTALIKKDKTHLEQVLKEEKQLLKWIIEEKKKKERKEKEDEKDTDYFVIDMLYKQYVETFNALKKKRKDQDACSVKVEKNSNELNNIKVFMQVNNIHIETDQKTRDEKCESIRYVKKEKLANHKVLIDANSRVKVAANYINLARHKSQNCQGKDDELAARSNYKLAVDELKKFDTALTEYEKDLKILRYLYKGVDRFTEKIKLGLEERKELQKKPIGKLLEENRKCEDILRKSLQRDAQKLTNEIDATITQYKKYTKQINKLQILSDEVYKELLHTKPNFDRAFNAIKEVDSIYTDTFIINNFSGATVDLFNCDFIADVEAEFKALKDKRLLISLMIQKSSHLQSFTCKPKDLPQKKKSTIKTLESPKKEDTNKTSVKVNEKKIQKKENSDYYGGLRISGKTVLKVGESASYSAIDGGGRIYTDGSVTWNSTREDIMNIGGSGNPVSAVAFKSGKGMILVTYIDPDIGPMKAWLDVKIEKEKELTDGNAQKDDKNKNSYKGAIFSIGGEIEEEEEINQFKIAGDVEEIEEDSTTLKQKPKKTTSLLGVKSSVASNSANTQCVNNYNEAKSNLSHNLKRAQYLVHLSKGCGWTSSIQAQINSIKKCGKIIGSFNAAINSQDAPSISGLQPQLIENRCNVSKSLWVKGSSIISDYNKKINEPQVVATTTTNNTRANADNMNNALLAVMQGMKNIQQMRDQNKHRTSNNTSYTNRSSSTSSRSSSKSDCGYCGTYSVVRTCTSHYRGKTKLTSKVGKKYKRTLSVGKIKRNGRYMIRVSDKDDRGNTYMRGEHPFKPGNTFSITHLDNKKGHGGYSNKAETRLTFSNGSVSGNLSKAMYRSNKMITKEVYSYSGHKR